MSRKDSKGRVLRKNESQRPDGRYEYRYRDISGKRKSVYSWRLTETDINKNSLKCLRELEKEILKDSLDGIRNTNLTLNEKWDAYISNKTELKSSTKNNYVYMYGLHVRENIGQAKIKDITYSKMKEFFSKLITEKNFKPESVETFYTMLRPVFVVAIRDGLIRLNPVDNIIPELKKSNDWRKDKKHPLTKEQTTNFLEYIKDHKIFSRWYTMFVCLFGTGLRIGEFLGLRWEDIYWKDNLISVNHNLIYRREQDKKMHFHVTTTKTKNANRVVPMLLNVQAALKAEKAKHKICKTEIDGYKNFIWMSDKGNPLKTVNVNNAITNIVNYYNKEEELLAQKENREPNLLPHFSAHICRHTFCTRLCEQETDLKLIQEIMGHSNITTTMDIYNESNTQRKQQSFERLQNVMF